MTEPEQLRHPRRVAAIDCGTNSIRLLIADVERDDTGSVRMRDITRLMRIVRLGYNVDKTGRLDPDAIERTLEVVQEYAELIKRHNVDSVRFVATSASRDAQNRDVFVDGVRELLNVEPEVVPGEEEAALSFAGAMSALDSQARRPALVVDIGGGSTELVIGSTGVEQAISLNMGSVRVTERFFAHCDSEQGIDPQAEAQAARWIDEQLDRAASVIDFGAVGTLVGVAGTVTTIAAQALGLDRYMPERIHGAVFTMDEGERAIRFMIDQPVKVKAALGFMPKGREDVIAGGALIWSRICARVVACTRPLGTIDRWVTSEHDILDGIALSQVKE
ncbi:MAG: exopolyphosphatase [Actinomyces sp.]|nr:exopolyphosphatase [Actinomyces sp.]